MQEQKLLPTTKQDLDDIDRQWAEFRRKNAKATERIAADAYHQQRVREEQKRVEEAYQDLLAESEFDKKKRMHSNLKNAAALMSGKRIGGSGLYLKKNENNASAPVPSSPTEEKIPQAYLLGGSNNQQQQEDLENSRSSQQLRQKDDDTTTNMSYKSQQQQQQQRQRSHSTATNNTGQVPRTPVTSLLNSSSANINNNNNNNNSSQQQLQRAKQPSPPSPTSPIAIAAASSIDLNDPETRKAVRLIERKVRAFLHAKLHSQRVLEMQRAATDGGTDASLGMWRQEVWVGTQMMRPRFQLPNAMVAAIEMQRRAAENLLFKKNNNANDSYLQNFHENSNTRRNDNGLRSPYAVSGRNNDNNNAGSNLSWVHNHLMRSADRFEKRKNKPALTTMDLSSPNHNNSSRRTMTPTMSSSRQGKSW